MIRLIKYLYGLNTLFFILIGFSLEIVVSIFFGILAPDEYSKNTVIESFAKDENTLFLFIFACIFAPLIETVLFQFLPFKVIGILFKQKKLKIRRFLYLVFASIIFGYPLIQICPKVCSGW